MTEGSGSLTLAPYRWPPTAGILPPAPRHTPSLGL